jgi:hypothetical protein
VRPELKGFARAELQPGESTTVTIGLEPADMATARAKDFAMARRAAAAPGHGQPYEPPTSSNAVSVELRLVGAARTLESCGV